MRFAVFNPDAERREGIKALLRQIDLRARFNDAPDWRAAERAMQRFSPNLLVVDWHRGIRPGELRNFANRHRTLPIAVLVDNVQSQPYAEGLLNEGARGIIGRSTEAVIIVKLLELILIGGSHLPADVLCKPWPSPLQSLPRQTKAGAAARKRRPIVHLSPRQEQILRCVHMGSTNKMIARALGISEGTVKIHLTSIFQQLGAPNRAAAVAIYNGLLSGQLEVLRTEGERAAKPVHGAPGVRPLRTRETPEFSYPLPSCDADEPLAMAAEPAIPWGEKDVALCTDEPASTGPAEADTAEAADPHLLAPNE